MKKLLILVFLLASMSVQADNTCDGLKSWIMSNNDQIDAVWMVMEQKKRLYVSTTKRHRPNVYAERKKDYEKYAVIYNNLAIVHNQQVEIYRENCK